MTGANSGQFTGRGIGHNEMIKERAKRGRGREGVGLGTKGLDE
jgi:hypothetical protein